MRPKPEQMKILNPLNAYEGKMKKSLLIAKLESEGIIKIRDESKKPKSETWKHSKLHVITDPMENQWGFIKTTSCGQRSEVSMMKKGKTALKIFGLEYS